MGLKSILVGFLFASVAALCLVLAPRRAPSKTQAQLTSPATASTDGAPASVAEPGQAEQQHERTPTAANASDPQAGTPENYVEQRIEELRDLGMTGDTNSLNIILSELTNRDPRVRRAAVDAAVQFGSRAAIHALADAWSQTDDPEEKVTLQKAIDFLKLPSLSERNAAQSGEAGSAKR